MFNIYCTNKLATLVRVQPITKNVDKPVDEWNAHVFPIGGKKCILFTDKESLYSVLLVDILKKDLKDVGTLFYNAFVQQLLYDNLIKSESLSEIQSRYNYVELYATDNDRKTIGIMNSLILDLKSYCDLKFDKLDAARYFGQNILNGIPMGSRKFANAKNMMKSKMVSICGE